MLCLQLSFQTLNTQVIYQNGQYSAPFNYLDTSISKLIVWIIENPDTVSEIIK